MRKLKKSRRNSFEKIFLVYLIIGWIVFLVVLYIAFTHLDQIPTPITDFIKFIYKLLPTEYPLAV